MEIEPSLFKVKVAAPPSAVFRALMTLPMVWPAVVVMLTCLTMSPSGPFERQRDHAARRQAAGIRRRKPGRQDRKASCDWNRSFRPKNCEKPVPPREDGVVASSCTTNAVAAVGGNRKLTVGEAGAAVARPARAFSAVVKLPTVVPMQTDAPPSTDRVPASKSTSMRDTRLPLESVTAMVVLPVKFRPSPESRPVSRPVERRRRRIGGVGVGLGIEGLGGVLREVAQGLRQDRPASGRACRSGPSASRRDRCGSSAMGWPISWPESGLMSWIWILP